MPTSRDPVQSTLTVYEGPANNTHVQTSSSQNGATTGTTVTAPARGFETAPDCAPSGDITSRGRSNGLRMSGAAVRV